MCKMECLRCGSKEVNNINVRYFVVPGFVMVPQSYLLCKDHLHLRYSYEDVYDKDGNRKKIDHESVMNRNDD